MLHLFEGKETWTSAVNLKAKLKSAVLIQCGNNQVWVGCTILKNREVHRGTNKTFGGKRIDDVNQTVTQPSPKSLHSTNHTDCMQMKDSHYRNYQRKKEIKSFVELA